MQAQSTATKAIRSDIDEKARQLFAERIEQAATISPVYSALWGNARDVFLAGGKRLRPYLVMVGYGSYDSSIINVALAHELLHVAMLMHDDIIDRDDFRHGRPNVTGLYKSRYQGNLSTTEAQHYAEAAATLAGDALLSEAYHSIYQAGLDPVVMSTLMNRFHQTIYEVIGGELIDVEAAFIDGDSYDPMNIYTYKTAGYSFIGPLVSGAICAGMSQETIHTLETYGLNAGIAFQMQDDLLGVYGDEAITGKSTLSDLEERKMTYLISTHKRLMTNEMALTFKTVLHGTPSSLDLKKIKQDMIESGAKSHTEWRIEEYYAAALSALKNLNSQFQINELSEIIHTLSSRKV